VVDNLTLIIPNKNDSDVISQNFKNVENFLNNRFKNFEILIVTNGSNKRCIKDTEKLLNNNPKYKQIILDEPGKGRAVKVGLENAKFENVLISDADFSVGIEELDKFIINNNFISPFIIGTRRDIYSQNMNSPWRRKFFGSIYIFFIQTLFGFKFTDTQCGFKYVNINKFNHAQNLTINGFSFDLELILLAINCNIEIKEIAVKYLHNNDSSVNLFRDSISMFISAIKLYKKFNNPQI
tara:strand:+ start:426 stop:1139 length:714 start_codon:yes stop_codon:yes gene_type:complete